MSRENGIAAVRTRDVTERTPLQRAGSSPPGLLIFTQN